MNGEGSKPFVVTRSIVNPETGGRLTVIQKQDLIAESVGHLFAIPTKLLLGRPQDIYKNPPPELIDQILERWADVPWKGQEVVVRIGHVDPKADWARARELLRKEEKLDTLTDFVGSLSESWRGFTKRFTRASTFSTVTNTVHLMDPNLAVAMHELGHAEDRLSGQKPAKGLFSRLGLELRASENAMKHAKTDQERKEAMKILEPAFGTYIGRDTSRLYLYSSIAAFIYSEFKKPKSTNYYAAKVPGFLVTFLGLKLAPVALAHIYSRLPGRKSSFGYIFEDSKTDRSQPPARRQVFTATGRTT